MAIIAVLVAIAVPLFVGQVDAAKKDVFNSNMRSVRSLAEKEILVNKEAYAKASGSSGEKAWFVTAAIDAQGNISISKIEDGKEKQASDETQYEAYTQPTGSSTAEMKVLVKESEVKVGS